MKVLEVANLSKSFGNFKLDNVTFNIESGYIMGLLGRNGAGKTTLIKLILNLLKKESGEVYLFGKKFTGDEVDIKERIGVVFENPPFPSTYKVKEIKEIIAPFYKNWDEKLYNNLIKLFEIDQNKSILNLSKGTAMKFSIALALSHKPDLLILDEPTSGLDPVSRSQFIDILQKYLQSEEKTVLYSTHIVSDIESITDYITIIDNGKILVSETRENLLDKFCIVKGSNHLLGLIDGNIFVSLKKKEIGFEGLINTKVVNKISNLDVAIQKPSIEKLYVMLVKRGDEDDLDFEI